MKEKAEEYRATNRLTGRYNFIARTHVYAKNFPFRIRYREKEADEYENSETEAGTAEREKEERKNPHTWAIEEMKEINKRENPQTRDKTIGRTRGRGRTQSRSRNQQRKRWIKTCSDQKGTIGCEGNIWTQKSSDCNRNHWKTQRNTEEWAWKSWDRRTIDGRNELEVRHAR